MKIQSDPETQAISLTSLVAQRNVDGMQGCRDGMNDYKMMMANSNRDKVASGSSNRTSMKEKDSEREAKPPRKKRGGSSLDPFQPRGCYEMTDIRKGIDVILSRAGSDSGMYGLILEAWSDRYEYASHTDKRKLVQSVIREMVAHGIRFFRQVGKCPTPTYNVEPPFSMTIQKKLLRGLRTQVLRNIGHLTPEEKEWRVAAMEEQRKEENLKKGLYEWQKTSPDVWPFYRGLHSPPTKPLSPSIPPEPNTLTETIKLFVPLAQAGLPKSPPRANDSTVSSETPGVDDPAEVKVTSTKKNPQKMSGPSPIPSEIKVATTCIPNDDTYPKAAPVSVTPSSLSDYEQSTLYPNQESTSSNNFPFGKIECPPKLTELHPGVSCDFALFFEDAIEKLQHSEDYAPPVQPDALLRQSSVYSIETQNEWFGPSNLLATTSGFRWAFGDEGRLSPLKPLRLDSHESYQFSPKPSAAKTSEEECSSIMPSAPAFSRFLSGMSLGFGSAVGESVTETATTPGKADSTPEMVKTAAASNQHADNLRAQLDVMYSSIAASEQQAQLASSSLELRRVFSSKMPGLQVPPTEVAKTAESSHSDNLPAMSYSPIAINAAQVMSPPEMSSESHPLSSKMLSLAIPATAHVKTAESKQSDNLRAQLEALYAPIAFSEAQAKSPTEMYSESHSLSSKIPDLQFPSTPHAQTAESNPFDNLRAQIEMMNSSIAASEEQAKAPPKLRRALSSMPPDIQRPSTEFAKTAESSQVHNLRAQLELMYSTIATSEAQAKNWEKHNTALWSQLSELDESPKLSNESDVPVASSNKKKKSRKTALKKNPKKRPRRSTKSAQCA